MAKSNHSIKVCFENIKYLKKLILFFKGLLSNEHPCVQFKVSTKELFLNKVYSGMKGIIISPG